MTIKHKTYKNHVFAGPMCIFGENDSAANDDRVLKKLQAPLVGSECSTLVDSIGEALETITFSVLMV